MWIWQTYKFPEIFNIGEQKRVQLIGPIAVKANGPSSFSLVHSNNPVHVQTFVIDGPENVRHEKSVTGFFSTKRPSIHFDTDAESHLSTSKKVILPIRLILMRKAICQPQRRYFINKIDTDVESYLSISKKVVLSIRLILMRKAICQLQRRYFYQEDWYWCRKLFVNLKEGTFINKIYTDAESHLSTSKKVLLSIRFILMRKAICQPQRRYFYQ